MNYLQCLMTWLSTQNTCPICRAETPLGHRHKRLVRQNAIYIAQSRPRNPDGIGRLAILIFVSVIVPLFGIISVTGMVCFLGYSLCVATYYSLFP
jgi:hypothetical protein